MDYSQFILAVNAASIVVLTLFTALLVTSFHPCHIHIHGQSPQEDHADVVRCRMAAEAMGVQIPDTLLRLFHHSPGMLSDMAEDRCMADPDHKCHKHDLSCVVFSDSEDNAGKTD